MSIASRESCCGQFGDRNTWTIKAIVVAYGSSFYVFQSGYRFMRSHANYSSNGQNGATGRQHPQLWVQRSDIHRWVRWPTMLADSPVGLVDRLRHWERLGLFWNAGLPKRRDRIGSNSQLEQCNSKIIFVDTECSPGPNKRRRRLGNMP